MQPCTTNSGNQQLQRALQQLEGAAGERVHEQSRRRRQRWRQSSSAGYHASDMEKKTNPRGEEKSKGQRTGRREGVRDDGGARADRINLARRRVGAGSGRRGREGAAGVAGGQRLGDGVSDEVARRALERTHRLPDAPEAGTCRLRLQVSSVRSRAGCLPPQVSCVCRHRYHAFAGRFAKNSRRCQTGPALRHTVCRQALLVHVSDHIPSL